MSNDPLQTGSSLEALMARLAVLEKAAAASAHKPAAVPLLPGEKIRVLFVAQHPSIWPGWRSVHRAMCEHPAMAVTVTLSPFIHPAASEMATLERMRECLVDEGVTFVNAAYLDLKALNPHVVFLQNPYDETRLGNLRSSALIAAGARVAYIPYGLEVGGGAWNIRAQFDLPVQRNAWKIFARSERHKKLYAAYNAAGNSNVVVTGHPKFDTIPQGAAAALPLAITEKFADRRVVLWTPHFSVTDIPSWSTFRVYADAIFAAFYARTDLFLLLRPHPLFFKSMITNGVWDEDGETQFRQDIENSSNIALDEGADYHSAFAASCALMTDVGSFLLEYLPTGKPLLYLHLHRGLGMNDEEELTRSLYRADCEDDILTFVQMIEAGQDPKKSIRDAVVPEYLSGLGTPIGQRICDAVVAAMARGDVAPSLTSSSRHALATEVAAWPSHSLPAPVEQKRKALDAALSRLPTLSTAFDMGCGNGRFTLDIARYAQAVHACDLDYGAVTVARKAAAEQGLAHVAFYHSDSDDANPWEKFDLVTCLDVTRCIVDEARFIPFLNKLRHLAQADGYVLVTEIVTRAAEQRVQSALDGPVRFRAIDDLRWAFGRAGLVIHEEALIEALPSELTSMLFVLRPARLC